MCESEATPGQVQVREARRRWAGNDAVAFALRTSVRVWVSWLPKSLMLLWLMGYAGRPPQTRRWGKGGEEALTARLLTLQGVIQSKRINPTRQKMPAA
eukprot:365279-Chlamydomonas_euryale.AAC.2